MPSNTTLSDGNAEPNVQPTEVEALLKSRHSNS